MFKSILANEMTAYLELREMSVSEGLVAHDRRTLVTLDCHLISSGFCSKELTEDVLGSWISTLSGKSKTINTKVGTVRGFVRYLNSLGNRSFMPDSLKVKSKYIPYIYSDEEIRKIMHYADNLIIREQQYHPTSFQLKVPMVIRVLYGCGTRLGETLSLRRKDVDFKSGTIFLKKTKFSKERVIPVHESLLVILERYCLTLGILHNPEAFLFPGRNPKHHYTTRQMASWFSEILRLADIDQRKKGPHERGACLHCFRHLFVLKSMQQLEAAGRPVDMNDLLLPTYLGRLLFQYLNEETEIDARHITFDILNFDLLTGFFDWLVNSRKNSRTTAKQRMGALSSFAEYAQCRNFEAGCVFRSSLARISKKSFRRVKGKPRSAFTRTELEILFSLPDTTEKLGWRDLVLLSVMYSSGARAQEICGLTVKDISHDEKGNAILTLRGKGEKSRRVKITFDATQLLNNYVVYRKIRDQPDRHIFPSQRNEHLSVPAIEEIFEKYITRAKTMHPDKFCNGPYTPHVMRHTTASHLIEAGVPLAVVKNILGHSSIQTTQIYVELSQQTVDRSMEEWNKKWFSKNNPDELSLPQEKNPIPDFLR